MTKKHYIVIAKILNNAFCHNIFDDDRVIVSNIAHAMAREFCKDNKNFNCDKFLDAVFKED